MFVDPKMDLAFKKLFGDINHKNIIMSFLNSVLERSKDQEIVDVIINDPNNLPETLKSKVSIVDVRCTDQRGHQYIVEMQVVTQKNYAVRAQYYGALALGRQLAKNENYDQLVPVIFIGILDFNLFKGSHYLSHHLILDTLTHEHELKHLEFHFIELTKFNKALENLNTVLEKWVYFFKSADLLEKVPSSFKDPALKEAFDVLSQSNWSRKELEAYDRYLDEWRSLEGQRQALEEIGMAKGMEKGKLEAKLEVAKNLLDVLDIPTIAKKTSLPIQEIEKLKRNKE